MSDAIVPKSKIRGSQAKSSRRSEALYGRHRPGPDLAAADPSPADVASPNLTSDHDPGAVLETLAAEVPHLTRQTRKAATWILDNPNEVGVSSMRELAAAADVKPNTLVRMARVLGFEGYEDFREPFREQIRRGTASFPDRARWLQSLEKSGRMGPLYADMVASALRNIEETFSAIEPKHFQDAAKAIWNSRQIFVLGVGVNNANARNFSYLASTGMERFQAIPRTGSTPVDDLARADERDVLIAMTCRPYRREVIDAVQIAKEQNLTLVGISDSLASPLIVAADHPFVVSVDTPQFFPSSVSTLAVLETLLSFVIAAASPDVIKRVETFHQRRHDLGIYADSYTDPEQ